MKRPCYAFSDQPRLMRHHSWELRRPTPVGVGWIDELPPDGESAREPVWRVAMAWLLLPLEIPLTLMRLVFALLRRWL